MEVFDVKNWRKLLSLFLAATIAVGLVVPVYAATIEVDVSIFGHRMNYSGEGAFVRNGISFVPANETFEFLGYQEEDGVFTTGSNQFSFDYQNGYFIFNGNSIPTVMEMVDDTLFIPVRQVLETLGYTVRWVSYNQSVHINPPWLEPQIESIDPALFVEELMHNIKTLDAMAVFMMMTPELQAVSPQLAVDLFAIGGNLISFEIVNRVYDEDFYMFTVEALYTTRKMTHSIFIDKNYFIAGFFTPSSTFISAEPLENANFYSEAVIVGEGTVWELDGILTVPHEASAENPVPVIFLVHGSGSHNMDSSIFNNRVFLDIANFLSSNGVAVLRFNERSFTNMDLFLEMYGNNNLTIEAESIEDALVAAEMLRIDDRFSNVIVAGLSMGGTIAPRIARDGNLDGAIMLAGTPRVAFELQFDQNVQLLNDAVLLGFPQEMADEQLAMVTEMLEDARKLMELSHEELLLLPPIFGFPGVYHLSLLNSLPLPIISAYEIPTLILHMERDWQIFLENDFRLMEEYTTDMAHVTTMLFEGLNHLLMTSQTPYNDIRDYMADDNVSKDVLQVILDWILNR